VIDRVFNFEGAREAFAHLESGSHFGKVVIKCSTTARRMARIAPLPSVGDGYTGKARK
jgi:hypothetical protein